MAVKASVTITISKYGDTDSITRYYKLQASTAAAPAVPTTLTPSGWSTSEPTYTSGSTNTLYFTDRYVFSDGTFQYTEVSKSTSYEAAKEAYNKAQAAQNSATSANNKIDNLQIVGRNLLTESSLLSAPSENANFSIGFAGIVTSSTYTDEGYKIVTPENAPGSSGINIELPNANNLIKAGKVATFSIDIKGKAGFALVRGYFQADDNSIWDNFIIIISSTTTTSEDWIRYSGSFVMPDVGTKDTRLLINIGQGSRDGPDF